MLSIELFKRPPMTFAANGLPVNFLVIFLPISCKLT
uniref:Uncharacterized protein n=1 Tax=Arundo donax TaxID=35708 RepID=A0A0A9BEL0_ARUDO